MSDNFIQSGKTLLKQNLKDLIRICREDILDVFTKLMDLPMSQNLLPLAPIQTSAPAPRTAVLFS